MPLVARLRSLLSLPLLVALLALVVALGGTSYAAVALAKNSVGARELKSDAVTSPDVRNGSLRADDFASGQLPAGPAGPPGGTGAPGSSASAVVTGRSSINGGPQGVSLTGLVSASTPDGASTLTPSTTTVLRDFSVKVATQNGARNYILWLDGTTTTLCTIPAGGLACTQTGSVTIPPSSKVALTFNNVGDITTAYWGMTLATS